MRKSALFALPLMIAILLGSSLIASISANGINLGSIRSDRSDQSDPTDLISATDLSIDHRSNRSDQSATRSDQSDLADLTDLETMGSVSDQQDQLDLVISGGSVVTMNKSYQVIEDGFIGIKGERIVVVGARKDLESKYKTKQVIDAHGKAVLPGLVNTHTHIPMVLFRGIADDLVLQEWLTKYIFPAEAKNVSKEFCYWGTLAGCRELIQSGTTTYVDMYYFEDTIAEATEKAGMRGVLGETVIDFPVADNKTHEEAMAYTENYVKRWKNSSLIIPAIAPHAPYTVNPEHLKNIKALAEKLDIPIVIHLAETQGEVDDILKRYGNRPIMHLEKLGLLSNRLIAAHVVYANAEEIALLKKHGVGVAHNPQSNMKLACGVAPVPEMLKAQVDVGLGTDGAASNNDLSMFEEMDTTAKLHKLNSKDPTVINAREALEMATMGGARAINLDKEIGSLEPSKRADMIIVDLQSSHQQPLYNIYSAVVYTTKAADVQTSIINGKIVMLNRQMLTLNEREIQEQISKYREQILRSLDK